ncbi:hypothetical protein E4U30_007918 [Claviceps sp. LM220 group G6]|nr:hypothetical protein E4U15_005233 [Claviceps sp. LM218 group G6]KAG6089895.1 hypothetical protein E4U31_008025 [Claviceps sp. LM219 group G6]KAG6090814.1 hypothetical protein E4U30_007918 [Claviceps sp. LM220 group G6]
MDQQNQFDALLEGIRKLQIEETDTPSKQNMVSQQETPIETLLHSQPKNDRALQRLQQLDEIIQKLLALKTLETEDRRKEDEIRHEKMEALELERDTALQQAKKKEEEFIDFLRRAERGEADLQLEAKNLQKNEERRLKNGDLELQKKDLVLELKRETAELQNKDALVQDGDKKLKDKNRQVQDMEMKLQDKETELQETKNALQVTQNALETSEILTQERVAELEERDRQLEEKVSQLQESNSLSQKKDIELSEQARLLQEKDLLLRFSTIGEYLTKCHVSYIPTVQMNAYKRTPHSLTKQKDRYGPTHVNLWEGFLGEQKEIFEQVCNTIGPDLRVFPRLITVEEIASNIRPIASEKELEMFINTYVENPVRHVMKKLFSVDPEGKVCKAQGKELDFRYYYFAEDMDDIIDAIEEHAAVQEVQGKESTNASKARTQEGTFRPDGMCVLIKWQAGQKGSILIFPYECKPPHNLTNKDLDVILKLLGSFWTAKRPVGILLQAWNSVRYALVQIYDYMVRSLSEFGILTTGTAIVFLRIDWANGAKTLQYHLARPAFDAAQASEADVAPLSAVGQYVSFIVRALKESKHGNHKTRMGRMDTRKTLSKVTMGTATNTNAASASTSGTAMR